MTSNSIGATGASENVPEPLVVDANPLLAGLLGGRARDIIFSGLFQLYSTQHTLFEVERYISIVASRLHLSELDVFREFQLLPVFACQPVEYEAHEHRAASMIGKRDPLDVPILAFVLARQFPLWTNDKDFGGLPGIQVYSTADLVQRIESN